MDFVDNEPRDRERREILVPSWGSYSHPTYHSRQALTNAVS